MMKRIFAFLLAILCMVSIPNRILAGEIDWASMTDEEITAAIKEAQAELEARKLNNNQDIMVIKDGAVLLDHDGLKLTVEGAPWFQDYGDRQYIYFTAVAENNTSEEYVIDFQDCSVNGWMANGYGPSAVAAGQKKRKDCYIYATDAGISGLEEIDEYKMCVIVLDANYHKYYKTDVLNYVFES